MESTDKSKPILVTGASGYLASWIVKQLLDDGYIVHGTVRNKGNAEKFKHLFDLSEKSSGNFKVFEADLLKKGSYEDAMKGCEIVIHTASPFIISNIKDPEKELLKPAKEGTINVLTQASKIESVKRIVLTSSIVAIMGDSIDAQNLDNQTVNESHWNTTSSANHQPYPYSKTIAEKEAWKMAEQQEQWKLVVINPGFIMGPSLFKNGSGTSIEMMKNMGDGKFKTGVTKLWFGMVDVRDVARAHILAALNTGSSGRHIIVAENITFLNWANILRKHFGDKYPFPKSEMPKFLIWLIGPLFGLTRKYVSKNVGYKSFYDNSYSKSDLGLTYRPIEETIIDHFQQLIDDGLV
ncbi:MAG: aldehyde reductase [Bacteroidota bacterium]